MKWIDFICIAEENGMETGTEIDAIEMVGKRYDISYTDENGYTGVIEVEEE